MSIDKLKTVQRIWRLFFPGKSGRVSLVTKEKIEGISASRIVMSISLYAYVRSLNEYLPCVDIDTFFNDTAFISFEAFTPEKFNPIFFMAGFDPAYIRDAPGVWNAINFNAPVEKALLKNCIYPPGIDIFVKNQRKGGKG